MSLAFIVNFAYNTRGFVWFKTEFSNYISFTSSADFISSSAWSLKLLCGALLFILGLLASRCFLKLMACISCQLIVIRAAATYLSPPLITHLWRTGTNVVFNCKICGQEIFFKTKPKQNQCSAWFSAVTTFRVVR